MDSALFTVMLHATGHTHGHGELAVPAALLLVVAYLASAAILNRKDK
jgi:hypothetical protein